MTLSEESLCCHAFIFFGVQETAQEMIGNIRDAFIELLEETHWMDEETRKVAKEKALFMNERIGYPDFLTKPHDLNKEYLNVSTRPPKPCTCVIICTDICATVESCNLYHISLVLLKTFLIG